MKISLLPFLLLWCASFILAEEILIDYNTGIVDGVPLPGDLASLVFSTDVGRTVAQILELNVTAQGSPIDVVDLDDLSHPCSKWYFNFSQFFNFS